MPSKISRKAWAEDPHTEGINLVGDSKPSALIHPMLLLSQTHILLTLLLLLLQLVESSVWRPPPFTLYVMVQTRADVSFFDDKNER